MAKLTLLEECKNPATSFVRLGKIFYTATKREDYLELLQAIARNTSAPSDVLREMISTFPLQGKDAEKSQAVVKSIFLNDKFCNTVIDNVGTPENYLSELKLFFFGRISTMIDLMNQPGYVFISSHFVGLLNNPILKDYFHKDNLDTLFCLFEKHLDNLVDKNPAQTGTFLSLLADLDTNNNKNVKRFAFLLLAAVENAIHAIGKKMIEPPNL